MGADKGGGGIEVNEGVYDYQVKPDSHRLAQSQAAGRMRCSARELLATQTQGQSQGLGYREGHLTADSAPTDESMYGALTWVVQHSSHLVPGNARQMHTPDDFV
jgi:hypothetical protein